MNDVGPFLYQTTERPEPVRVVMRDDQPWFAAVDLCRILGIRNSRDALARLDDDEKGVVLTDTLGGRQELSAVTESGMFALVLGSRKPSARRFRKWLTAEVLPALRKQGYYALGAPTAIAAAKAAAHLHRHDKAVLAAVRYFVERGAPPPRIGEIAQMAGLSIENTWQSLNLLKEVRLIELTEIGGPRPGYDR